MLVFFYDRFVGILAGFLLLTTAVVTHAQKIDRIIFLGPGMSSSLTNGAKSASVGGGAKLILHFGNGGWFSQFSGSLSTAHPQVAGATSYWSTRPTVSLGYKLNNGKSRWALFGGFAETRSKTGDFLPTAVGGVIVKIKGRWGVVTDISRNSTSWGTSTTLGYRF